MRADPPHGGVMQRGFGRVVAARSGMRAAIALRWREDGPLRRLCLWQRWLAVTGAVVPGFRYAVRLVAG